MRCVGSHGSTPKPVFEAAQRLTLKIEACPDYFYYFDYQSYLNDAREKLAKLIGAKAEECVLVLNLSMGIATVLHNFQWEEGDILLCSTFSLHSGKVMYG
jgi:selenocysteine lyase/cysteine desulfurase